MNELRVVLRGLIQKPAFTIISLLTLALGIGASTSIFSVVEGVLLRELPYRDPSRLVSIGERSEVPGARNIGFLTLLDWKARTRAFESMAVYRTTDMALSGNGAAEQIRILQGSADFLPTLGVDPLFGRSWMPDEAGPSADRVVLLAYGFWQRRFAADPQIIGKDIVLNEQPYEVIGVLPPSFRAYFAEGGGNDNAIAALSPLRYNAGFRDSCRTCRHLRAIARVRRDVTLENAASDLLAVHEGMTREFPSDYKASRPAVLLPLHNSIVDSARRPIVLSCAAAVILLLATCLNVSILILIRATARQNELSIRAVLGAGAVQLVRQCVLESLSVAVAGGAVGILFARWMVPVLIHLAPSGIPRMSEININAVVLALAVAVTLLSGVAAALIPSCQILRKLAQFDLKPRNSRIIGSDSGRLRNQLVTGGLACTFALLVAVGLLVKSFDRLIRVDTGFRTQNLIVMNLNSVGPRYPRPEDDIRFFDRVIEAVKAENVIQAAAATSVLPISGNYDMASFQVEGQTYPSDSVPAADRYVITPDYLAVMGIPVIHGRSFSEHDEADSPKVVLISATAARKFFGTEDPIGKSVRAADEVRSVVGVVGDVHQYGLDLTPTAQFYVPLAQQSRGYMTLVVKSEGDRRHAIDVVSHAVATIDPTRALSQVAAIDDLVSASVAPRRFVVTLVGGYGALALFLAVIGIYGTVSFTVIRRNREIGIRMALGAQRLQIFALFLRHVLGFAIPGLAIGAATIVVMAPLIRGVLFEVDSMDPLVILIVAAGLMTVVLFASFYPIRRATRLDANVALRED